MSDSEDEYEYDSYDEDDAEMGGGCGSGSGGWGGLAEGGSKVSSRASVKRRSGPDCHAF
jgi:hypothetical protein